jgi:hypothetical protein
MCMKKLRITEFRQRTYSQRILTLFGAFNYLSPENEDQAFVYFLGSSRSYE